MNQQEQLARDKAPVGGGFVCMICKRGSNIWEFVTATKSSNPADDWWAKQHGLARVWWVKPDGQAQIWAAK